MSTLPPPSIPTIANVFFRSGEIETWGRGIQRIFAACEAAGTPKPRLRLEPNGLWLDFPFALEYLKAMPSTGEQVTAEVARQVTPPGTGEVTGQVTGQVAGQVGRLLAVLAGQTLRREEMQSLLKLQSLANFRDRYLMPALAAGLIERTIPDKPNSRLQKYRLTTQGRDWPTQHPSPP